jgi:hypothetical protein
MSAEGQMTRWGILMTYQIVGPILLIFIVLQELSSRGVIDLSERTPIGSFLYTPAVMLTMALGLSMPIIVILAGIIIYRFGTDWPVTFPAMLFGLSTALILAIAFLSPPERLDDLMTNISMALAGAAVLAMAWAGWFTKAEPLG